MSLNEVSLSIEVSNLRDRLAQLEKVVHDKGLIVAPPQKIPVTCHADGCANLTYNEHVCNECLDWIGGRGGYDSAAHHRYDKAIKDAVRFERDRCINILKWLHERHKDNHNYYLFASNHLEGKGYWNERKEKIAAEMYEKDFGGEK